MGDYIFVWHVTYYLVDLENAKKRYHDMSVETMELLLKWALFRYYFLSPF
jgi:hypothetical protein